MRAGRKVGRELDCVPVLREREGGSPRTGVALGQQQQLGVTQGWGGGGSDVARKGRGSSSLNTRVVLPKPSPHRGRGSAGASGVGKNLSQYPRLPS